MGKLFNVALVGIKSSLAAILQSLEDSWAQSVGYRSVGSGFEFELGAVSYVALGLPMKRRSKPQGWRQTWR